MSIERQAILTVSKNLTMCQGETRVEVETYGVSKRSVPSASRTSPFFLMNEKEAVPFLSLLWSLILAQAQTSACDHVDKFDLILWAKVKANLFMIFVFVVVVIKYNVNIQHKYSKTNIFPFFIV